MISSLRLLLCAALLPLTLCAQETAPPAAPAKAAKKPDPSLAPITDTPGLPRVLLIGDSISMGYTLPVRELLKGKANVHRIPENGSSTDRGLVKIADWIGTSKWDVIHFNWGLHDLKHWKDGRMDLAGSQVSSLPVYEKNLAELVARLKATGARLIWANTTQVPEGSPGRVEGDEAAYNAAAQRVMEQARIPVDDLHDFLSPRITELQLPHNVHFNPAGYKALGEKVAESISAELPKK